MNYLEFFKLQKEPFSTAPDTRFYFNSKHHSEAIQRLNFAIKNMKGLAVLIGGVGTGKTLLARRLLDSLSDEEYESALLIVIHSQITSDWFLKKIAMQFGVEELPDNKVDLLGVISKRLMKIYEEGKKAIVLVDEAQMLNKKEIMEELRGLLNIELPDRKLITFVLFGLPELKSILNLDPPLSQRVAVRFTLRPFDEASTEEYIKHRINLAEGDYNLIFEKSVYPIIHRFSKGIPRMINTICDNSLFEAYLLKKNVVDEEIVKNVITDLGLSAEDDKKEEKTEKKEVDDAKQTEQERLYDINEIEGLEPKNEIEEIEKIVENIEEVKDS